MKKNESRLAKTLLQNGVSIGKTELLGLVSGWAVASVNITKNIKRRIGVSNLDAPAASRER